MNIKNEQFTCNVFNNVLIGTEKIRIVRENNNQQAFICSKDGLDDIIICDTSIIGWNFKAILVNTKAENKEQLINRSTFISTEHSLFYHPYVVSLKNEFYESIREVEFTDNISEQIINVIKG